MDLFLIHRMFSDSNTYVYRPALLRYTSPENLRRSIDNINKHLAGFKKLDLFESARVDPKIPVEDVIKTLAEFIEEGKFDYIGLSECSAETLRKADAVCLSLHVLVPTNCGLTDVHLEMSGASHCGSRNRGQPMVLRRGNEER